MPTSLSKSTKNIILINHSSLLKPKIFLKICRLTEISGALNNPNFDGNAVLIKFEDSKYLYISGPENFEFRTSDKITAYISLMGNNKIPYVFALGLRYTYFISTKYNLIEKDKI